MDVKIEILNEKYYDKACDLINKVFKNADNQINVDSIIGKLNDNVQVLSARIDEEIVGLIVMSIMDKPFSSNKHLYLDYVCTDTSYRKLGIGRKMMAEVERYALEHNCAYITFTSNYKREDAHAFYKKLNYSIVNSAVFKKEI